MSPNSWEYPVGNVCTIAETALLAAGPPHLETDDWRHRQLTTSLLRFRWRKNTVKNSYSQILISDALEVLSTVEAQGLYEFYRHKGREGPSRSLPPSSSDR